MNDDDLIKQLLPTFMSEMEEHIAVFRRGLVALADAATRAQKKAAVHSLFRVAHTLKSTSRLMSLKTMERACHDLESILQDAREGAEIDEDCLALLIGIPAQLADVLRRLRSGESSVESALEGSLSALQSTAQRMAAKPKLKDEEQGQDENAGEWPAGDDEDDDDDEDEEDNQEDDGGLAEKETGGAVGERQRTAAVATQGPAPSRPLKRSANLGSWEDATSLAAISVRVGTDKLDRLINNSGELIATVRRTSDRLQALDQLRFHIEQYQRDLRGRQAAVAAYAGVDAESSVDPLARLCRQLLTDSRAGLQHLSAEIEKLLSDLGRDSRITDRALDVVKENLRELRMFPFERACDGIELAVRELSIAHRKKIELRLDVAGVEMERGILDELKAPLLHLTRNAIVHGIEEAKDRIRASKSLIGHITVKAIARESQVEITVSDDGRGLDEEQIRARARQMQIDPSGHDINELIFRPGFSTSPEVNELSGRGIGLDIVKNNVERMHGHIEVKSAAGKGTAFILTVPLSLTMARSVFVKAGGHLVAFVVASIDRTARVEKEHLITVDGHTVLMLQVGEKTVPLPVASLSHLLGYGPPADPQQGTKVAALLLKSGTSQCLLLVDELVSVQEVMVRKPSARFAGVRQVSGTTIMPDGTVALLLNAPEIVRTALKLTEPISAAYASMVVEEKKKRLLVVDDSLTTRSLVKSILEAAGYEVATASDGEQAWRTLQLHGTDLVVSDVEMPNMDGFGLTEAIRQSQRFANLPVVLVTGLANDRDRARGLEAGADAYLVKSDFDQSDLLAAIKQLM
ncbi:MAG TPA: response regulator [Chroococcales cyanobacterium]